MFMCRCLDDSTNNVGGSNDDERSQWDRYNQPTHNQPNGWYNNLKTTNQLMWPIKSRLFLIPMVEFKDCLLQQRLERRGNGYWYKRRYHQFGWDNLAPQLELIRWQCSKIGKEINATTIQSLIKEIVDHNWLLIAPAVTNKLVNAKDHLIHSSYRCRSNWLQTASDVGASKIGLRWWPAMAAQQRRRLQLQRSMTITQTPPDRHVVSQKQTTNDAVDSNVTLFIRTT